MNEHSFIRSIHRLLPQELYIWKINDNYAGGVADAYYSGPAGDLWVEYKFEKLPKRDSSKVPVGASAQQRLWLSSRAAEGRTVLLVVGSPEGVVVLLADEFDKEFLLKGEYISRAISKKEFADILIAHALGQGSQDEHAEGNPKNNKS